MRHPIGVRRVIAVVSVVALLALGAWLVLVTVEPAEDELGALSVAVNAVAGQDPSTGMWGSCEYSPDARVVLLRARYECVVRACSSVEARLEVVDRRDDHEWQFEFDGKAPPYVGIRSGRLEPVPSTTITREDVQFACPDLRD